MSKGKGKGLTLSEALGQVAERPVLAAVPPPAAKTPEVKPQPMQQPSRQGTKTIAGHFQPQVSKQFKQLALDLDSNVQELLREAIRCRP